MSQNSSLLALICIKLKTNKQSYHYSLLNKSKQLKSQLFLFFQATCRCPKNLRYWPETDRCYPEHSRGPCEVNQYLKYESEVAVCQQTKICENGWIFWPPLQDCFQLYTQGPCHKVCIIYLLTDKVKSRGGRFLWNKN